MTLWCRFSLGSIVCGGALDAETGGGEFKSCLSDWCYARQIFHGGIDNSFDEGYADLYLEGGPNRLKVVMSSEARAQGARQGTATPDISSSFCHRVTQ
jgi:hypothetical protein